jgi:hypothetical protein
VLGTSYSYQVDIVAATLSSAPDKDYLGMAIVLGMSCFDNSRIKHFGRRGI